MTEKEFCNEYCKYSFTKEEIDEMSAEMARLVSDLETAEDEKKAVMSDFKGKIDSLTATIRQAAGEINNGYEMRNIKCEVIRDHEKGKIMHMRTDNGEIVRTKKMTDDDRQMEIV
jgi:hypothetical protein